MSVQTAKYLRFGGAITLIVMALVYLAYTGVQESKSAYVTIKQLHDMGDKAYNGRLRVAGNVLPGSIRQVGTSADFTLVENGEIVRVKYKGSEPPPDTFKDNSQALVLGTYGKDGVFHATELQAKCASKYAPQQQQSAPAQPQSKGYWGPLPIPDAPPVRTENVSKIYGRTAAVRKVSLELQPGRFYVLRGENGAGKSTLLRMIAGLNEPTEGSIQIFGEPNRKQLHEIGYMAHAPLLYDELGGMENLRFFARLYGVSSDQPLTEAMQRVGLDPALERRVGQYSQGMRQRLSLARAIFHSPRLLLLDEPFSNVDPESASQIADRK